MEMAEQASRVKDLEADITTEENHLQDLRNEYMKLTGHMPVKKITDFEWKWSVFMGVGFAYITMIYYVLGVDQTGINGGFGIPPFFFGKEIELYAILSMYPLLMVMMSQARKLGGLQSMAYILGFWCMQWLFYDWSYITYHIGVHAQSTGPEFWNTAFGRDFLIVGPPMWLFLTEAIVGFLIGLYTFTFPRSRRHLIPPILWLYGTYFDPSILKMAGVSTLVIVIVAICFLVAIFGLIGYFLIERIYAMLPVWRSRHDSLAAEGNSKRKWKVTSDPLGFPMVFAMIGLVATMQIFLVISPAVGVFFGFISWYIVPIYYIIIISTGVAKMSRKRKITLISILTSLILVFFIVISLLPLDTIIG
jgi:hypothetical protein